MSRSYHRAAYFGHLEFPTDPVAVVGVLKGKSNFQTWHSAIQPILLSNASSSELIIGVWTEPRCPTPCTAEQQAAFDEGRRRWHTTNTGTCRFIRATLAENVVPFVRQYNTAKTLFFNLVWLYGEDSGIDTQGGPPVPVNAHTMSTKRGRASLLAVLEAKRTLDYLPPVGVTLTIPSPTTPTSVCTVSSSSSTTDGAATRDHLKSLPSTLREEPSPEHHLTLIRSFERACISDSNSHSNQNPNLETIHEQDHEQEEPHPGRRIRISSGHAIGSSLTPGNGHGDKDGSVDMQTHTHTYVHSERSISPLTLSDSTSTSDEVSEVVKWLPCFNYLPSLPTSQNANDRNLSRLHLEDIGSSSVSKTTTTSCNIQHSRPKKRQASAELGPEDGGGEGDEGEGEERRPKASIVSMFRAVKPGKARKWDKFSLSSFPLRRLDANGSQKGSGKEKSKADTGDTM
ncbi:hypothetical protein G647_00405 [Cladophialophora carrionii CBS 160.54]|uniref:Uncharacterized protein n=1 Tax=Cladophialophora carrionii CBS 160.54 TaxID=1279043 RepID=V9DMT7_9EURO|nr:uncharacterized protein G647_00405 [Cladophialophora carrionii CBS 160.54]ETI27956.1 hypothetical protein G647_00405 [Cladophialophora carrionii CBS 160.54]